MEREQYLTVTALTKYIKFKFDCDRHLENVLLTGEISNFKHNSKGHFYFTLKDDGAQISALMFAKDAAKVKFEPSDGMKVFVKGKITVYETSGSYQIYVSDMKSDGIGDLYLRYEQLKKELMQEGLFDEAHKRPIKRIPSILGVITSPTGAAVRDIINTVSRRYPFCKIIVYPAQVQGENAKFEIVSQIKHANDDMLCDTLIVGRGGGSIEDLWAFNERIVAEAIYSSKIPVISAVGHEVDFTIADFVADKRAATPTAGAEIATPDIKQLRDEILFNARTMTRAINNKVSNYKQIIMHLDQRLDASSPKEKIVQRKRELRALSQRLMLNMNNYMYDKRQSIKAASLRVNALAPLMLIKHKREMLEHQAKNLVSSMKYKLDVLNHSFNIQREKLEALNPLKIMDKGYSIPSVSGKVVKSVKNIKKDDTMTLTMKDGIVISKVMEVEENGTGK